MASFGVGTIVVSSGQVLLIRRKDFEVWAIPAGGVEDGESAAHRRRAARGAQHMGRMGPEGEVQEAG